MSGMPCSAVRVPLLPGRLHVKSIERLQLAPRCGLPRRHEASGRPDPSGRHGGQTSGVRRSGLRHRLRTRQSLIGTRCFGTGHRREPYSSNTASWADVSGLNTLKIGRGKPRRSKGDNPYPTSSKAFGPRDPADVPHRASRGGAVPFLTTAHGATRQPRVDSWSRCPHVPHGPRRLWSRWPVRAARASVSWHA